MARSLVISAERRKEWATQLRQEISDAKTARSGYLDLVMRAKEQYRSILPYKDRPWPGCSNIAPPITPRAVEQVVQRSVMQYLQGREYIHMRPASGAMADRARKVEGYHQWQAEAELDYGQKVDKMQRSRAVCGTMFAETSWAKKRRRVCDLLELDRDFLTRAKGKGTDLQGFRYAQGGDPQRHGSPIEDVLDELFGPHGYKWTSRKKAGRTGMVDKWNVRYKDARGLEDTAIVSIDKSEELGEYVEVMAEIYRMVKDQPVINVLRVENVIVSPGQWDIQSAPLVAVRSFYNTEMIESLLDSGDWYLDGDERDRLMKLLTNTDGEPKAQGDTYEEEDELLAADDDYIQVDSTIGRGKMTPVFRCMTEWDIRGDGELVDAELVYLPRQNLVVRAHYDSVSNRSGMRNIVSSTFLPLDDQLYGLMLPEFIRQIQEEANVRLNQMIDRNSITANPFMFLDPAVHWERDNALLSPGSAIPIPDPQRNVMIPNFPSSTGEDMALLQQLDMYAQDMLGGFGPLSAGRSEGTNNSNRTWRGAQLLVAQTSRAVEYQAEMMRSSVCMLWKQIYSWNAMNIPKGKEFRVLGTDEVQAFESRADFRGDYDFVFDVDGAIVNSEIERFLWTEYFQLFGKVMAAPPQMLQPGLIKFAIEAGKRRRIPNPQQFYGNPPIVDRMPMTPEQEHQLFAAGQPVEIHPQDNPMEHAEKHMAFAQAAMDPNNQTVLPPQGQQFFIRHLEATLQQVQQLKKGGGAGMGPGMDMASMNGQPGGPPGPQPPAVTGVEGPNQGPGVEMLNGV